MMSDRLIWGTLYAKKMSWCCILGHNGSRTSMGPAVYEIMTVAFEQI